MKIFAILFTFLTFYGSPDSSHQVATWQSEGTVPVSAPGAAVFVSPADSGDAIAHFYIELDSLHTLSIEELHNLAAFITLTRDLYLNDQQIYDLAKKLFPGLINPKADIYMELER